VVLRRLGRSSILRFTIGERELRFKSRRAPTRDRSVQGSKVLSFLFEARALTARSSGPGSTFARARGRRVGQLAPAARLKRLRPAAQRER
jgi:hypothetical protein